MRTRLLSAVTGASAIFLLSFSSLGAVIAQDDPPPAVELPDLGGREVVIAVENAYPPYNFIDEAGNAVGWDYDTFNEICRLLNCVPVFEETAWTSMLAEISTGEFDVAADGITYTAERDETVDFSHLYQAYDEALMVREGEDRFASSSELLALDEFAVASQTGTTNALTAEEIFGADNVQLFDTFGAAVQALVNDDVDAVLIDRPAAEGYLEAQGGLRVLDESLKSQGLAFAFPPGSDLIEPVNAAMDAMVINGSWDEIYARWFLEEGALPDLGGIEVTIAVENAYPPYNYLDDNGNAVGWDYDTFRVICRLLNCVPVFEETAWTSMLAEISTGEFDVAADGITYTAERDETVDFSQLYQAYDEALMVREGEDRFSTSEELLALGDFAVASQTGTTNALTAEELFGADNVQLFDTFGAAVQALANDDVDAVLIDRPAAEGYLEAQGGLRVLDESLTNQGLAFAFPPSSELVEPVNAAMDAMIASGSWDVIYRQWFEAD